MLIHSLFALLQAGYRSGSGLDFSAAQSGMFLLIIVIGIVGYLVQARLQSVFRKYSRVEFPGGLTGAEVAEKMLRDNNIHNVKVTHVKGHLTDHFNPQTMTVNLSDSVYSSSSVAAAAVAAHECGHAVQHAQGMLRWFCGLSWCRSCSSLRRRLLGSSFWDWCCLQRHRMNWFVGSASA